MNAIFVGVVEEMLLRGVEHVRGVQPHAQSEQSAERAQEARRSGWQ